MARTIWRKTAPLWTALRIMLLLTLVLGIGYPLVMLGIGQSVFPHQANGSVVRAADGRIAGSELIGQRFADASGAPLPEYFQPRPSAAGDGYDALASAGSNLGPESEELALQIEERRHAVASFNEVPASEVPTDAVTASGSGLDPHISPAYAALQVARVAEARGLPVDVVTTMVSAATSSRDAGYLGESRVNVVELNLALDALAHSAGDPPRSG